MNKVQRCRELAHLQKFADRLQDKANKRIHNELQKNADQSLVYVLAVCGIVLHDKYHWDNDKDPEHGMIVSFFERVSAEMQEMKDMSIDDIIQMLEDKTGIIFRVD